MKNEISIRTYKVPLEDLLKKYNIKGKIINIQYKTDSNILKIEVKE